MRALLIGQAPGPNTDPELPLFPLPRTSAGGRLQQMMGITRGQYLTRFERLNLLYGFPGKDGNGEDKFPARAARAAALTVRPLLAGRTAILVGRNVADAFQFGGDFFEWVDWPVRRRFPGQAHVARAVVVPHPSGRNRWYNDQANLELAREFWDNFFERNAESGLSFPAEGCKVTS